MEKPAGDGNWINGGFMVCEPEILDLIESVFEQYPLQTLAKSAQWILDTLRDKIHLNELWEKNKAPWKIWDK